MTAIAGKSDVLEGAFLDLLFLNIGFGGVGDVTGIPGSATAGQLFWSLHTADPTEEGNQSSSEVTYGAYARVGAARSSGGFVRTGNSISPAATVSFPKGTSGSGTATFFGIGTASSGAGKLLYAGPITPGVPLGLNITPQIESSSTITES
jgi:hypothetical protein